MWWIERVDEMNWILNCPFTQHPKLLEKIAKFEIIWCFLHSVLCSFKTLGFFVFVPPLSKLNQELMFEGWVPNLSKLLKM
jgi:hypothetical protein